MNVISIKNREKQLKQYDDLAKQLESITHIVNAQKREANVPLNNVSLPT